MTYLPNRERESMGTNDSQTPTTENYGFKKIETNVSDTTKAGYNQPLIELPNIKRRRPYKTELGKMREEKQKWLYRFFTVAVLALAELIVIILIAR